MADPNLVTSGRSQRMIVDGQEVQIEIYRLETQQTWTLELVDERGISVVWDELFNSDQAALDVATNAIEEEGLALFREQGTVIPFPRARK